MYKSEFVTLIIRSGPVQGLPALFILGNKISAKEAGLIQF
jgi:hypothetical protein